MLFWFHYSIFNLIESLKILRLPFQGCLPVKIVSHIHEIKSLFKCFPIFDCTLESQQVKDGRVWLADIDPENLVANHGQHKDNISCQNCKNQNQKDPIEDLPFIKIFWLPNYRSIFYVVQSDKQGQDEHNQTSKTSPKLEKLKFLFLVRICKVFIEADPSRIDHKKGEVLDP